MPKETQNTNPDVAGAVVQGTVVHEADEVLEAVEAGDMPDLDVPKHEHVSGAQYTEYAASANPSAGIPFGSMQTMDDAERAKELAARMQREVAALRDRLTSRTVQHIKYKGAQHFILGDDLTVREIEIVVVAFTNTNAYYATGFVAGTVQPPLCYAIDPLPHGMIPRDNSPAKQHHECDSCKMNQFKSHQNGRGKACRNARRLAVLLLNNTTVEKADLCTIDVPPTSLKAFDRYVTSLAARYGCMPVAVLTRVTLDPNETYSKLNFEVIRPLTEKEIVAAYNWSEQAEAHINADMEFPTP